MKLNSKLRHISIGTVTGTTDTDGFIKINLDEGRVPIAAVPYEVLASAIIVHTAEFFAKVYPWNNTTTGLANTHVVLLVFYVTT